MNGRSTALSAARRTALKSRTQGTKTRSISTNSTVKKNTLSGRKRGCGCGRK